MAKQNSKKKVPDNVFECINGETLIFTDVKVATIRNILTNMGIDGILEYFSENDDEFDLMEKFAGLDTAAQYKAGVEWMRLCNYNGCYQKNRTNLWL